MLKRIIVLALLAVLMLASAVWAAPARQEAIELGSIVQGEVTDSALEAAYTLTLTEGQAIVVEVRRAENSDLYGTALKIQDPDGDDIIDTTQVVGDEVTAAAFVAEMAGDYTIIATRGEFSSSTGEFLLRAFEPQLLAAGDSAEGDVTNETLDQYYLLPADQNVRVSYTQTDGNYYLTAQVLVVFPSQGAAIAASMSALEDLEMTVALETDDDLVTLLWVGVNNPLDYQFNEIDSGYTVSVSANE